LHASEEREYADAVTEPMDFIVIFTLHDSFLPRPYHLDGSAHA